MRKIIVFILIMTMSFSFVGCGAKEQTKAEKYCFNCGEGISKDAIFCEYCGTAVKETFNEFSNKIISSKNNTASAESASTTTSTNVITGNTTIIGGSVVTSKPTITNKPVESSNPTVTSSSVVTSEPSAANESSHVAHTHLFSAATCTKPKQCSCGTTEGSALGHRWEPATKTSPKTCSVCKQIDQQDEVTRNWFVTQYNIAKQQYINTINNSISTKRTKIASLQDDASALYVAYMKEVDRIRGRYAGSPGTLERALKDAQLNYTNSAQVYTSQINALKEEITDMETEVSNPNVDNILTIVTKNCNISSKETYQYYSQYKVFL